jgi:hypothetical protein
MIRLNESHSFGNGKMPPVFKILRIIGGLYRERSFQIALVTLSIIFLSSIGVYYF